MYEIPTLIEVGRAEEVILGIASFGDDLDGRFIFVADEFADDLSTGN